MEQKTNYPYVTENNLRDIQDYQYSLWQGDSFISAFLCQRQGMRDWLPAANWLQLPHCASDTAFSLWPMVKKLRGTGDIEPEQLNWALILLKKFEVSKRLYSAYEPISPYKICDENNSEPEPYMLLAEVALRQWQVQGNTYWLSAALKLIDTLCSLASRCNERQQAGISALIEFEQQLIVSLLEAVSE